MADGNHFGSDGSAFDTSLKLQRILEPMESEQKFWDEQAAQFARELGNKVFILNGGALVAIPSFAAVSQNFVVDQYLFPMLIFVIGLFFGARAHYFGFLACSERSKFATCILNSANGLQSHLKVLPESSPNEAKIFKQLQAACISHFTLFNKYRRSGFLCTTWALLSFLLGVIIAGLVII